MKNHPRTIMPPAVQPPKEIAKIEIILYDNEDLQIKQSSNMNAFKLHGMLGTARDAIGAQLQAAQRQMVKVPNGVNIPNLRNDQRG